MPTVSRAVLVLAACGAPKQNRLQDRPTRLADVHAPHVAIMVDTHNGMSKVWLDTGAAQPITAPERTILVDDHTTLQIDDHDRYVIVRGGERKPTDVKAAFDAQLSPDRSMLVVVSSIEPPPADRTQPQDAVVTLRIADGASRRYPVPTLGPERATLHARWTKAGDAVMVSNGGRYDRLNLASGEFTQVNEIDYRVEGMQPSPTECREKGVRLDTRNPGKQQQIVLVPMAAPSDPEHLTSATERVVIRASDHSSWLGEGGAHFARRRTGALAVHFFTPGCTHFVFSLEEGVYVGDVVSGRFALVTRGARPALAP